MAAYIKTIIDKNGDTVYPYTKTNAVFDNNGNQLTNIIDNKANISDVYNKEEVNNLLEVDTSVVVWERILKSIKIVTAPTKTVYNSGETLNTTGLVVKAVFQNNFEEDVTNQCTFSPNNGTELTTIGDNTITVSYTENEITKTATFTVTVQAYKIVTWAAGTDEEIVAMVEAADKGLINLADYWTVGQERQVSLSVMAATGVRESHVAQTVTMVLMNAGGKTLANATESGRTTCSFIVGLKNGLANGTTGEYGYMNSSNTNTGGWDSCARRTWCNSVFREAIPASLRSIFKQHLNITANGSSTTTTSSTDYFALPAEKEVFGSNTYGNSTAETSLTQFSYYATSSNRIKKCGDSDSADRWWERSPISGNSLDFCNVNASGGASSYSAYDTRLVSPFGCI